MQRCNDETKGGHTGYMPIPDGPMSDRVKVGTSHGDRYSYWLDADRYVYQYDERASRWNGWLCSQAAWDSTFVSAPWIVAVEASHA